MRIAVIGAAGRTGRHVVTQALARGDEVRAVARAPERIEIDAPGLRVVGADVHDAGALSAALTGVDAVVSALGTGTSRGPTDVYSTGARATLAAMRATGADRVAVISAAPAGPREEQRWLERRMAMPLLERFFGALYDDMRRMEAILAASDARWVALRPPRLVDQPARGAYRIDTRPLPRARTLTYPDLATALLDALDRDDLHRHSAYVAS